MKYFVLLVICLLSFSVSAFEDILYDFNTRTPGTNIYAFKAQLSSATPTDVNLPNTQITTTEYSALKDDDQTYQNSAATTNGSYATTRYLLFIDEDEADITQINVLWNGYGVNSNNGRRDGVNFYIWNFRTGNAVLFAVGDSSDNEVTLTG